MSLKTNIHPMKKQKYNFNIAINPPPLPTMQKREDNRLMERFGKEKYTVRVRGRKRLLYLAGNWNIRFRI